MLIQFGLHKTQDVWWLILIQDVWWLYITLVNINANVHWKEILRIISFEVSISLDWVWIIVCIKNRDKNECVYFNHGGVNISWKVLG